MKKRRSYVACFLWMMFYCIWQTGCADGLLDEIPRDFVFGGETSEEVVDAVVSPVPAAEEEQVPAVCFLMEGAFPYAYETLNETEQIWYRDIEQVLGSFGSQVRLSQAGLSGGLSDTDINKIFQCVLSDHPELFYVEGYSYVKYARGEKLTAVEFSGTYNVDLDTAVARKEEIEAASEEILSGISRDAADYDKVKYVYETLIRSTDYDLDAPDNQNIYSVFVQHLSVCQGYAKATQYLLNRLNVPCTLVLGTVETGEGHAWNLVEVDGEYYYLDTTWGDVSYRTEDLSSEETLYPGEEDETLFMPEINYDYLNVTTEELLRTHSIGGEIPMPLCDADTANYYVREGALFTGYDRVQMEALFQKAIETGQGDITIKCVDAVSYKEVLTALIEEQEIFDYLAGEESRVAYAQNEKQHSLTFWVTNE